jgi:flagellar basal body rod protein FlgG
MDALSATSLSGMHASQTALDVAAFNIANLATDGFHRQQAVATATPTGVETSVRTATSEGASPEADLFGLLAAKNGFLANLAVFRTGARMGRTLLDVLA